MGCVPMHWLGRGEGEQWYVIATIFEPLELMHRLGNNVLVFWLASIMQLLNRHFTS